MIARKGNKTGGARVMSGCVRGSQYVEEKKGRSFAAFVVLLYYDHCNHHRNDYEDNEYDEEADPSFFACRPGGVDGLLGVLKTE